MTTFFIFWVNYSFKYFGNSFYKIPGRIPPFMMNMLLLLYHKKVSLLINI